MLKTRLSKLGFTLCLVTSFMVVSKLLGTPFMNEISWLIAWLPLWFPIATGLVYGFIYACVRAYQRSK